MTYYDILEISEQASEEVVRMAYKALAKKYHPDVYTGDPSVAEDKMKHLNAAFSVLSNAENRMRYDAYLRGQKEQRQDKTSTYTTTPAGTPPRKKKGQKPLIAIIIILLLLIIGGMGIYSYISGIPDIEDVKDSVVMIEAYDTKGDLLATGSGFCAFKTNWIATNFHVIEGAKSITVVTDSHKKLDVDDIIFFSKEQDLAVVSIDGSLAPLKFGDGKDIETKDDITTIGSPKGELNTVSEGIISNVDDKDHIRITAPISHGSSGGVLLNRKNEVIGITSAGYNDAQNLNFAINISLLEKLYSNYKSEDTTAITAFSLSNHIGSLSDFNKYLYSGSECYTVASLDVFYKLTDNKARFEALLENQDYSWYAIYDLLSRNDQETVVSLFMELNDYEFNDNDVAGDINDWDTTDFFISLDVLNRYE